MEKLTRDEIDARLSEFPDWAVSGEKLQRTFKFDDFVVQVLNRYHQHPSSTQT